MDPSFHRKRVLLLLLERIFWHCMALVSEISKRHSGLFLHTPIAGSWVWSALLHLRIARDGRLDGSMHPKTDKMERIDLRIAFVT